MLVFYFQDDKLHEIKGRLDDWLELRRYGEEAEEDAKDIFHC